MLCYTENWYIYLLQAWPLRSVTAPVVALTYMQLLLQLSREYQVLKDIVRCHNNAIIYIIHRNSLLFIKKCIVRYYTLLWISVLQHLIKQLGFVLPSACVASRQLKIIATVLFVAYSLQNIPSLRLYNYLFCCLTLCNCVSGEHECRYLWR